MIKMTTPTHRFCLPFSSEKISDIRISYAQKNVVKLTKKMEDCVIEGSRVLVTLSQEETSAFAPNENIQIQMNLKTIDGKRFASRQFSVACDHNLYEEVM